MVKEQGGNVTLGADTFITSVYVPSFSICLATGALSTSRVGDLFYDAGVPISCKDGKGFQLLE